MKLTWKLTGGRRSPIGLDIGARSIGAIQLLETASGWRVEAGAVIQRQPMMGGRAGGGAQPSVAPITVEEMQAVEGALDRQGFTGNRVVMTAPEWAKFSATLELPPRSSGAPIAELARQELARAAKRDPGTIEVGMWDVPAPARGSTGAVTSSESGPTHLLAMGMAHQDADVLMDAAEGAGFVVEAVEGRCCAMARACARLAGEVGAPGGQHVSAILDVTEACASIAVVHSAGGIDDGIVAYDRPVLEVGLSRLREEIQAELRADGEAIDFLLEAINSGGGLGGRASSCEGLPEHSVRTAMKLINEYVALVVQELRSVMAYAIHRYPGAIGPVLLTGPGARLAGLRERIRSDLDLDARAVVPRDVVRCSAELDVAGGVGWDPSLTVAVGMAMRPQASRGASGMRRAA